MARPMHCGASQHQSTESFSYCASAFLDVFTPSLRYHLQGGIHARLRRICIEEMLKRPAPGFAVGGLSGGEEKDAFWRTMKL